MRRSLTPSPQLVRRTSVSCQAALVDGRPASSSSTRTVDSLSASLSPPSPRSSASPSSSYASSSAYSSGAMGSDSQSCRRSHRALLSVASSSSSLGSAWLSPGPRYQPQLRRPFASSSPAPPAPAAEPSFYIPGTGGAKRPSQAPPLSNRPSAQRAPPPKAAFSSSKQAIPADVLRQAGLKVPSKAGPSFPPPHLVTSSQAARPSPSRSNAASAASYTKPPSDPKIVRPDPAHVPLLSSTTPKFSWADFADPILQGTPAQYSSASSSSLPFEIPVHQPALTPYVPAPLAPGTPAASSLATAAGAPAWDRTAAAKTNGIGAPKLEFLAPTFFTPGVEQLSQEQKAVHDLVVKDGVSIFYTGSAGTGKSILLKQMIKSLREKWPPSEYEGAVAVTASTGIAGYNIGGHTLHSFAGIGLGEKDVEEHAKEIAKTSRSANNWKRAKVLIIDEVSMIDGKLLDKLAIIGSHVREDPRPFGGLQLVLCGDFLQLPPVTRNNHDPVFAFESQVWPFVIERMISLTTVFRQKDPAFVNMLNEMRFGAVSEDTVERFRSLSATVEYPDGVLPTELFPLRSQVAQSNGVRMALIKAESKVFHAADSGFMMEQRFPAGLREHLLNNLMAPPVLELKPGAQVMLIVNQPAFSLYNGSVGIVREFIDGFPRVVFTTMTGAVVDVVVRPQKFSVEGAGGKVVGQRMQVPLILAWALSIHKSQGQTLDRVKVNLDRVFARGQSYVALSRVTSLEGLQVLGFSADKVMCHPRVTEWNATRLETLALPPPDTVPAPSPTTAGLVAAASENGAYVPPMFTPRA